MIFVEPEKRVGNQIVANFVTTVVVDEGAPIGMRTLTRVGVFEEMGAVEFGKAVTVTREVRGSPIEQDADAFLVATIDEVHEIGGRAEAASSGVVAESLIAPGAIERVLHDGEQFDVGVAELFDVGN